MNDSAQPKRPQPKLMTKSKFFIMFCALLVGASLGIVREYRSNGTVSVATIGASIAAFIIGLILILVIGRYANKPEKWNMMHLKLSGLIPIFGGIYGLLLAYRVIPRKPKDPEKMELWHRKFGKIMKILSPFLIGFGILELFGVLWRRANNTVVSSRAMSGSDWCHIIVTEDEHEGGFLSVQFQLPAITMTLAAQDLFFAKCGADGARRFWTEGN